jgi:thiol-disulfide isomerase/thioredoxin
MIKSKLFWLAAICLAIIPLLVIDIAWHSIGWKKEVREEIITVVQNVYSFNRQQKAAILDKVFERNQTLTFLIYSKSFACIILAGLSFYFLRLYRRQQNPGLLKPAVAVAALIACFILVKLYLVNQINTNLNIQFLTLNANDSSFQHLYNQSFRGKVLYIDFWGTTCGPCLQEFRDFTQPLKDKYKDRHDIAYLYVAQGNQYLWRAQIKKYKIDGFHVFVKEDQYEQLYRHSTKDSAGIILMPRYLIIDKTGNIVETNARQPSDRNSLYTQLDKYLSQR